MEYKVKYRKCGQTEIKTVTVNEISLVDLKKNDRIKIIEVVNNETNKKNRKNAIATA